MWVMSSGTTSDTSDGGDDMDFDLSPTVGISERLRNMGTCVRACVRVYACNIRNERHPVCGC